jgi:hypothetical protein
MATTQPLPPLTWKTTHHTTPSPSMATCRAMWSQQLRKLVDPMANQAAGCRTQPTRENRTQHVICNLTNQRLRSKLAIRKDTAPSPVISLPCQYSFNDTSKTALRQRRQLRTRNVVGSIDGRIKATHPAQHPQRCIRHLPSSTASRWTKWRPRWTGYVGPQLWWNDQLLLIPCRPWLLPSLLAPPA